MGLRFLALACLVGAALAGPVQRQSENRCAKQCVPPSQPKFHFEKGKAYVYHFQTENVILTGTRKQNASLEGTAEFHLQSQCEGILKIRDVRIQQKLSQDEKDDLRRKLELPMPYVYVDGKFENVCPISEDSTESLNIKRSLISSLVNEMPSLEKSTEIVEKDSFGKCLTKYTVQRNGDTVIKKEKDMRTCSNKKIFLNFIKKELPSIPLFEKNYLNCTQRIQNGIIKSSDCQESQKLKSPLEDTKSWMEFSGKLSLRLIETKPAEKQLRQEPLYQEEISYSVDEPRQGDKNVKETEKVLKRMCSKNKLTVDMAVGKDFIKLVSLVKSLSYRELDDIYESLKNGRLCDSKKVRDIFVDCLPVASTNPSIKLMVKILLNGDVTGLKSKYWPASLALKSNPTKDTIDAVLPLIQRDSQSKSTLIGVTSLIYRLCASEDCEEMTSVKEIVKIYNKNLGSRCSFGNENQILASLRAFGNMGYHGEAHKNILACAQDKSKPKRIRLAAIDSFRRMHIKRPQEFVQLYSDKDEDIEVRIALFKTISEYPDERQMKQIKRIVESESSEQVSAFVSTFLQNKNKTHVPRHLKFRGLLKDMKINPPKAEYITNSKNIEFSFYNKELNTGASIETDVIHEEQTKLPIAVHNRLDATLFGKELNLLEMNVRTEGLDDILKRFIELINKLPQLEKIRDRLAQNPSFEEIKEEYKYLSPKKVFEDARADLSLYLRILGIQIFDASTNDLSGIKEMLKIAELMTKLARGEKTDFSHSVVLMNTKVAIPSITGRSYSVDLVGSSTVGVTAESKADFLKLPKNLDVHFHFQPSVNLEFSTTVGIQSSSHRPDMRVVSRLHLESDVEVKGEVKNGHVATFSFTLPSENIALANISTNVFEIDEENNEKLIFEKTQKKVNHCLKHLHKPLGVSACATVELPKPFVTRKFPFVMPFGNAAFTLLKSDPSIKSYELRFEIPKHSGPNMKYRASFDTPRSKISRRFSADLEVKQEKDQKDVVLELVSPFETVGGKGSFTNNDNLLKGSVELHTSEIELMSANFTSKRTSTRSRNMYQINGAYSIRNRKPAGIDGTVTIIRGRKEHITVDFKTNKSQSEPVALKATIMKEGRILFSKKSEWKLSSEVSVSCSRGAFKLRKTLEKRSKNSQSISANVGLDYQLKGKKKHSISILGTSQKSSSKVNTNLKVQSTQYPKGNLHLTWDIQRESQENITNDIKLTDGQKPYKTYFNLKHKSRMPKTGPGICTATIEIPPRDIYYELTFAHDINISEQRRINIEADLCYKKDKHIKGIVDVKYESLRPLKGEGRLELEYPGGHYILEDKIEETNGVIKGESKFQYREGEVIQLHYNYKKLSNDSKVHHEIESSIQTPFSRSPISSKASIELSSESLAIVGQVGPNYSVQAHLKDNGPNHINIKMPMIEGTVNYGEEDTKKTVDVDLKVKTRRPRHIIGSMIADSGNKKKIEIRVQPDVDEAPEKKILISTTLKKTSRHQKDNFVSASKIQILDLINLSIAEEGEVSLFGDYECTVEASIKTLEPMGFRYKRETGDEHGKTIVEISKSNVKKAKIVVDAKLNEKELSIETSVISLDQSFEDVRMYLKNQVIHSGSSKTVQTSLSFQKKDKVYKTEFNSDLQPNGLELKAQMQTPHENYEKNAVGFSIQVSDNAVSSSVSIDCSDNKKISIQTEFKTKGHACSFVGKVSTPYEIAKKVQLQVDIDNHHSKKSFEAYIDVNEARICDIRGNMKKSYRETDIEGGIKVSNLPVKFQGLDAKFKSTPSHALVSGNIQIMNNKQISWVSEIKEEGDVISTTTTIVTPYRNLKDLKTHLSIDNQPTKRTLLCYVDFNGERKGDIELSIASSQDIEVKGRMKTVRTPEISAHIKCEKTGESFSISANVMKGTSPLLSSSFNRLSYQGGEKLLMKTKSFEDTLLDLEISKDASGKDLTKYSFKAEGPFSPVSLTFTKNYNDRNSVSTELRACKVKPSATCYSLKSYHKNLINSGNYRFYQKVTMDLEKSVGGSYSKPLGRLHVLMTAAENDYRSKVTMEVNEKKLGYELKLHSRTDEDDKCSFDSYFHLPRCTSRVRIGILHNTHRVNLEADAIPDIEDPTRKLSFEVKKEINPDNKEVSGYIKVNHPRMTQPLLLTCKLQPVGDYFVKGKLVLHSGPVWGKTLMIEVFPNIEQEAYGIRSIEYKFYTDDKSIDGYLKLIRQSSRSEEKIGYEWKYHTHEGEKNGGMIATISRKTKTLKVKYSSPSSDYEVQGSVAQGPDDINLSVSSYGRKLKEISVSVLDSCADIVVSKSGPLIKSQICVNKQEGNKLQLLKIDVQYGQHKCVDVQVTVDPEKPEYLDVVFDCNKEESCRALKEIINIENLLKSLSIKDLKQKLVKEVKHIKEDILETRVRKLRKYLEDKKDDLFSKVKSKLEQNEKVLKEYIRKVKEAKEDILKSIKSALPVCVNNICQKYYQKYYEVAMKYYQKVLDKLPPDHGIASINDIKSAFRRFDVKKQIDRKIKEIKQALKYDLPKLRIVWPSDVANFFKDIIISAGKKIGDLFRAVFEKPLINKLRKYGRKFEKAIREKTLDIVDLVFKKFNDLFSGDEDLKTARDLILYAKDEILKKWRRKEEIVENSTRRMETSVKENWEKIVKKEIPVFEYDPDQGHLRLKIRQPLTKYEIESVTHGIQQLFHKILNFLRR